VTNMTDDKFTLALWDACQSAKLVETGRTLDDVRHAFDRYISDGEDTDSAMKAAIKSTEKEQADKKMSLRERAIKLADRIEIELSSYDPLVSNIYFLHIILPYIYDALKSAENAATREELSYGFHDGKVKNG